MTYQLGKYCRIGDSSSFHDVNQESRKNQSIVIERQTYQHESLSVHAPPNTPAQSDTSLSLQHNQTSEIDKLEKKQGFQSVSFRLQKQSVEPNKRMIEELPATQKENFDNAIENPSRQEEGIYYSQSAHPQTEIAKKLICQIELLKQQIDDDKRDHANQMACLTARISTNETLAQNNFQLLDFVLSDLKQVRQQLSDLKKQNEALKADYQELKRAWLHSEQKNCLNDQ